MSNIFSQNYIRIILFSVYGFSGFRPAKIKGMWLLIKKVHVMARDHRLLAEKVAASIVDMIVKEKRFGPCDKLPNEMELAAELDVSRTTIREAVKQLVSNGVLEVSRGRGRGTFVTENPGFNGNAFSLKFFEDHDNTIIELHELRMIIEPEVAYLAVDRATDEEIAAIVEKCDQIEAQIRAGEDNTKNDQEFHSMLARASHNRVITRFLPVINQAIFEGVNASKRRLPRLKDIAIECHRKIATALINRDPVKARDGMLEHIQFSLDEFLSIIEERNKKKKV